MGYSYLSTTFKPVGLSVTRLFVTIPGMRDLLGTVRGVLQPYPQKPGPTSLRFLLLCGLLTLCSHVSSPIAESGITSKQLLTTYSMTCTELERKVSKSYSEQGCLPLPTEAWPMQEARWYACPIRRHYGWAYANRSAFEVAGYCSRLVGSCKFNGLDVNVFYLRSRYGSETCEGDKK